MVTFSEDYSNNFFSPLQGHILILSMYPISWSLFLKGFLLVWSVFWGSHCSRVRETVVSWLGQVLTDEAYSALMTLASSAALFSFLQYLALSFLKRPIQYCSPGYWEILISLRWYRPKHKSICQKSPIFDFFFFCLQFTQIMYSLLYMLTTPSSPKVISD